MTRDRVILSFTPYTGGFMATPQVSALNLTTTALKESIKAATLSLSQKSMLTLVGSVQCHFFTNALFIICYTDNLTLKRHFA